MINFWNDRELARKLGGNKVSSSEEFWYFLLFSLASSVVITYTFIHYTMQDVLANLTGFDVAMDIILVLILVIGTKITFNTNRKYDDKEFIKRSICLGFPISIQVILLTFLLAIFYSSAGMLFTEEDIHSGAYYYYYYLIPIIMQSLGMLYFYYRLNSSIKIAAGVKDA